MEIIFYFNGHNLYSISKLAASLIGTQYEKMSVLLTFQHDILNYIKSNKHKKIIFVFSFTTPDWFEMSVLLKKIKSYKNIICIAGGAHTSALPFEMIKQGFDYVFVGEGEKIFLQFLNNLKSNKVQNKIYFNTEKINLNDYAPFAYNLNLITPVEIMRGCCNNCKYCQTPNIFKGIKFFNPASLIPYIKYFKNFKRNFINFLAPMGNYYFQGNLDCLETLFENVKLNSNLKICYGHFPSELYPKYITEELLALMKRYCVNKKISIGFQSGSEKILKNINRIMTVSQMLEKVRLSNRFGFIPIIDFLFGLPDETVEDRIISKKFIENLLKNYNVLIHPHIFLPLPETEYWLSTPAKIESDFLNFLSSLPKLNKIKLNWQNHLNMQKKIIEYRDKIQNSKTH